jgi:hypothetical protein
MRSILPPLLLSVLLSACSSVPQGARAPASAEPRLCAAVRGNGQLITAHWGALAKLLESEGVIDGGTGGSSGSISLFLQESILANPLISAAPTEERGLRASLLMKSLFGYLLVVKNSEEATSLISLAETVKKAGASMPTGAIGSAELPAILAVLKNPELRALVNPEFIAFVQEPGLSEATRAFRIQEAKEELQHFGDFSSSDPRILYRPGAIDFRAVAIRIGRVGDFLAGRGKYYDAAGVSAYLSTCAPLARGMGWFELMQKQPACANQGMQLIAAYRQNHIQQGPPVDARILDPIGKYGHFVVTSAVLDAPEMARVAEGARLYAAKDPQFASYALNVFDQAHFGYFGSDEDLARIDANPSGSADLKSRKARTYRGFTWRELLSRSPAEPGLAPILPGLRGELGSAAGWVDLAPTLQLRNLGCDKVVYVTREGQDSTFAQGVARLLGMTDAESSELYDTANPKSSFSLSIQAADLVQCTRWDSFNPKDLVAIETDAYHAPLAAPSPALPVGCGGAASPPPATKN